MKMMGIRTPASANSRCNSRPLTPGRLTSRTRQLGPSGRLLRRNSSAVSKDSDRKLADFSSPWMAARTEGSSSTTNTVGVPAAVIHVPRLWWVGRNESLFRAESCRQPTSGIHAVEHEVHQHLLQLHAIAQDRGKLCRELRSDRYVISRRLAAQEDDHLSNDFVYVHHLPLRSTLLEEQTDPADDFRRTHSVFRASHGSRARFFHVWGVARQPANAGIGVGDGSANRLVHFVGQGGSQLSHGGHPVHVREVCLRLT